MKIGYRTILAIAAVIIIGFGSFAFTMQSSLSGYQSITAEWYKIRYPNAQFTGIDLEWDVSGNVVSWDADDTQGEFGDGMDDMNSYQAETEQPKWFKNIRYKEWWLNDTVTVENPEGVASHYEWAIDLYNVNVNFRVTGGYKRPHDVEFWMEFQNNVDSVFKVLGAEEAASYIIYAQTENYTTVPTSVAHSIITPSVSNFELHFLDIGETIPPSIPEVGSDLDFDKLTPYSHVGIKFTFTDFGTAGIGATQPVVNMLVQLNVLTLGRFDYALTYVEAGEDDIVPIGILGLFDSIGAALDAGFGALLDGMVGLGLGDINWTLVIIVIVLVIVAYVIIKLGVLRRGMGGS